MKGLKRFFVRVLKFIASRRGDERLREEMREHVALQTEENMRAGMAPAEARRQAVLKLGAAESIRETYHAEEGYRSSKAWCTTFVMPFGCCANRPVLPSPQS